MENQYELINLENDVVSGIGEEVFQGHSTFTGVELMEMIKDSYNPSRNEQGLFEKGIDCKVLKPGKGWLKGKIRLTLEFCPEQPTQPPSPLDDLRQQIKEIES